MIDRTVDRKSRSRMPEKPKRQKESFDASEKASEILSRLQSLRGLKGLFINLCIEIAAPEAFERLKEKLNDAGKGLERPRPEKGKKSLLPADADQIIEEMESKASRKPAPSHSAKRTPST